MKSDSVDEGTQVLGGSKAAVQFCVGDGGGDGE